MGSSDLLGGNLAGFAPMALELPGCACVLRQALNGIWPEEKADEHCNRLAAWTNRVRGTLA